MWPPSASRIPKWATGSAWRSWSASRSTSPALRAFTKGRIANFKQPELLLIVDELPLTDFGKVDRKDLRARFAAQVPTS